MMRSMYSGVSGLRNHQTRMDVIGNNIANINTAGYKKSRVVFQDTLYQTMRGASRPDDSSGRGGTNPMGIGLGMSVSSIDQIHTGSPTMATNKLTDMGIDGNGYFIISDGKQEYYTRAGNFEFDTGGKLVNSNGYNVIGWISTIDPVTGDWSMDTSPGRRIPINIASFKTCSPQATREMIFSGNLNAETPFNEVQTLAFATNPNGGAAGGEFRLEFGGQYTEWIKVGSNPAATAANIQKALENLGSIGKDNVAVSWNPTYNFYEIKFQGDLASRGVPLIGVEAGPAAAFDGGNPVYGGADTQNQTLAFATIPGGGTPNGGFTITVGNKSTGAILVGADENATAANIANALNAVGATAGVTWNVGTSTYDIAFTSDPGQVIQVHPFAAAFDGGAGTVGNREMGATSAHILTFGVANGGAQGGVFRLSYNGQNTGWIAVGADSAVTAANMRVALENLSNVGAGNIAVNWNDSSQQYEIRLQGALATADVPTITVTAGPNPGFDGGAPTVGGTTQNATLAFATTPGGGTQDGGFTITLGGQTTDMILVGANEAATATNIQNALNALGIATPVAVAWNGGTNTYDIDFNADPGVAMTVTTYNTGFTGGVANIVPPAVDVYYPTDQQSIITAQEVFDSHGNKETIYYRFFKYEIDEGPPRVSRWAVDMSLNNPLFEKAPGYSASTGFESVDLDTTAPVATMSAGSAEIIRLTNLQFDDKGRVVGGTPDLDPFILTINRAPVAAEDIVFKMDFSVMTQFAGNSFSEISQNGYPEGTLTGYTVGIDGVIRGSYDNGETRDLARVALANFQNPAGLAQIGGTIFQKSVNSGEARINPPTESGMGKIVPSSLEMSNVDLSEEFTDMITTQRGFQANSRIITTSDEMIQELVNLKR
ncbi:flagellar hook-basal body complex protein [Syntrophomonas wolfei]|uniref:flagellar hook-basal body complex protein n=1 Tax=Syntrophomonas wolfei TaxID=863 RepID=UPI0023F320BD|nr:flagellar hook-basal body complex protein [Syntrophomonas wolfei]